MLGVGIGIGVTGHYVDTIAPTLSAVEVGAVADNKIVLTYSENLDTGSVPATTDFTLTETVETVSSVAVAGAAVTLTLTGNIYDNEVITVSYTAGANPIRDKAHNNVGNLSGQAVTNNSSTSTPVQLTIAYTATQFVFKWKAPNTKTLVFHWGDGTTSSVAGNNSTLVTTTSSYSGAGTYNFWITGDVLDLTYIDIRNQTFVSGDVSTWSALTNLAYIAILSTGVSGDVSGWSVLPNPVINAHSCSISGDISSWAALTGSTYIDVHGTSVSGDVSALATLTSATILIFYTTSVTFDNTTAWTNTSATISLHNCSWTSTMVNNAIEALSTCTNSTINIAGTNAHRTSASNDDLNTLLANRNTITLNDTLGAELHTNANAASITNEADATTGWTPTGLTGTGANVFESQSAVKSNGSYALHADANDTPTGACNFAHVFTVDNAAIYRISFDWRHIGSGGDWIFYPEEVVALTITNADTTFEEGVYYLTMGDTSLDAKFRELSGTNNGGIYLDNFSLKKVTFD